MPLLFANLNQWMDTLPLLLLESALKVTVILLAALALLSMIRRASSALRHALWTTALLATLILPLFTLSLPKLHWLPSWLDFSASNFARWQASGIENNLAAGLLLAVWGCGVLTVLSRLFLAQLSLSRLARRGSQPASADVQRLVWFLAEQSGASIRPQVLISQQRRAPMTWGIWNPRLLLPGDSLTWPPARLEAAILHELAHIQRRDCLSQALSQVALALFWFHPLVWYANHRIRIEREQACDDWVLDSRSAVDYAEHLLSIAAGRGGQLQAVAAMNMAQPSLLERRVRSILDGRTNRKRPPRRLLVATGLSALFVVVALAALQGRRLTDSPPRSTADARVKFDEGVSLTATQAVRQLRGLGAKFRFQVLRSDGPSRAIRVAMIGDESSTPDALLLAGRHITDEHLQWLQHLPSLKTVYLSDTSVSDGGLKHLSQLHDLQVLALNRTDVSDEGLQHLQSLAKLNSLHLSNTQVTSQGLSHLAQLGQLKTLSLNQTAVGDAGLSHLLSLSNLTTLQVFGTRVTSHAIDGLKRKMRQLTIYSESAPRATSAASSKIAS